MISPIYWHPRIYSLIIRILEGRSFKKRHDIIIEEIKDLNVLDIGCADCYLSKFIKKDKYVGADVNKKFVSYSKKRGIKTIVLNVIKDELPRTECIVLSNILHQTYPYHEGVLKKSLNCSSKKVIVAEHLKHIASSKNRLISYIAMILNNSGQGVVKKRLSKEELFEVYKKFNVSKIKIFGNISIAVFDKSDNI